MLGRFFKGSRKRQSLTAYPESAYPPIFVRGVSRSGGTLLVTLLDAHPEIAMSYELYPGLLQPAVEDGTSSLENHPEFSNRKIDIDEPAIDLDDLESILRSSRNSKRVLTRLNTDRYRHIRVFVARTVRSGIDHLMLADLVAMHRDKGRDLASMQGRFEFIELVCGLKMNLEGKKRWGLKCSSQFSEYLEVWPEAYFLNIIRDGRDVLASQLHTGNFKSTPAETGRGWSATHLKFRELVEDPRVNALEVLYERLATEPRREIEKICDFLGIEFDQNLLAFHQKDLSIYKNPAAHLSLDRISKPIDTSKIGRWREELTSDQLDEFYSTARDAMLLFEYLES